MQYRLRYALLCSDGIAAAESTQPKGTYRFTISRYRIVQVELLGSRAELKRTMRLRIGGSHTVRERTFVSSPEHVMKSSEIHLIVIHDRPTIFRLLHQSV